MARNGPGYGKNGLETTKCAKNAKFRVWIRKRGFLTANERKWTQMRGEKRPESGGGPKRSICVNLRSIFGWMRPAEAKKREKTPRNGLGRAEKGAIQQENGEFAGKQEGMEGFVLFSCVFPVFLLGCWG